jgi:catechol 2,3-dioxygenase-like lactoylglutathione lyase family enzyme
VIAMDITIHASFLPHDDPDASLTFYRDTLGFEVRNDVGRGTMRWITVGPPGQPDTSILLAPPTFERLQASDAEVVQEPTDQPYGIRDCAFRDPAGNLVRIQELL